MRSLPFSPRQRRDYRECRAPVGPFCPEAVGSGYFCRCRECPPNDEFLTWEENDIAGRPLISPILARTVGSDACPDLRWSAKLVSQQFARAGALQLRTAESTPFVTLI